MKIGGTWSNQGAEESHYSIYSANRNGGLRKLIASCDTFKVRVDEADRRPAGAGRIGGMVPCGRQLCCCVVDDSFRLGSVYRSGRIQDRLHEIPQKRRRPMRQNSNAAFKFRDRYLCRSPETAFREGWQARAKIIFTISSGDILAPDRDIFHGRDSGKTSVTTSNADRAVRGEWRSKQAGCQARRSSPGSKEEERSTPNMWIFVEQESSRVFEQIQEKKKKKNSSPPA